MNLSIVKDNQADECIRYHALLAGFAGLVPVPIADVAGIGAVQVRMIQKLAEIYEVDIDLTVIKQLIATMLGAKLTQTMFSWIASFIKGLPGPGTIIGEAIQGVISMPTTFAIGKAAKAYFRSSMSLGVAGLQEAYNEGLKEGKDFARSNAASLISEKERLTVELEEIKVGLAKNLGKDAEFIEALRNNFIQIRNRMEQEAEVDKELRDILDQAKFRLSKGGKS
ncbi:MAG: DUF697 domain-containing protein [Deltaproteobacteria bacterium]|nr:DUF697 domain-containing protein [Deltaproteobacteria bacterium]